MKASMPWNFSRLGTGKAAFLRLRAYMSLRKKLKLLNET
jgi:hypothetical protein